MSAARTTQKAKRSRQARKLFVLDTNVLMHDPMSLFRFEEHDIFVPMMTLEELDNNKKGMTEVARNARQAARTLDAILSGNGEHDIAEGIPLDTPSNGQSTGRLFLQTEPASADLPEALPNSKFDNQILGVVMALQRKNPRRPVVLVSKDINMRIKAHALQLRTEDYFNDQVIEDRDLLYAGMKFMPADFWDTHGKKLDSWKEGATSFYRVSGPQCASLQVNEFVAIDGDESFAAQVREVSGNQAVLEVVTNHSNERHSVWGISARNAEQNFALNLLMNPEIDFVTLLGPAGTGKTLLTLAAALEQTIERKQFAEIIVTRVTVPVGEEIGFLPGTEEEKMTPWMGAIEDNLDVLMKGDNDTSAGQWAKAATTDLIRNRIKIKSLSFMRGRTFIKKFLIIDEAQNLTPKQMKTLITRAGEGTKVVCLGNLAQIDTPYLTEGSSGLAYAVERFRGWEHAGHVTLSRGERSRLADKANEVL